MTEAVVASTRLQARFVDPKATGAPVLANIASHWPLDYARQKSLPAKTESQMRRIFSFAFLALALCSTARADVLASEEQLQPFAEKVMAAVAKSDLDAAFASMKPLVVIPQAEFDALIVNTRAARGTVGDRYGKSVGYECVNTKKVGQSLVKITCFEKTEKHALPWIFYFYKTPAGWVLNSFVWTDSLPSLFN